MRTNPYEPSSNTLLISILLTLIISLTIVSIALIPANPDLVKKAKSEYNSAKEAMVIKLLELAGETPETAPIAIVGSCENIENEEDCTSTGVCDWKSIEIRCDFADGSCPEGCTYEKAGFSDCNNLATSSASCNNLPGNFCNWIDRSCEGQYPTPESCTGILRLPESCYSKDTN